MGSLITFIIVAIVLGLTLFGWTMVLKIQRERKISELKIQFLRVASSEESAYQRYIQTERQLQDNELKVEKSRQTIFTLRNDLVARRKELREMIEKLRIVKRKYGLSGTGKMNLDDDLEFTRLVNEVRGRLALNNEDKKRIALERQKISGTVVLFEDLRRESVENEQAWENIRRELDHIEAEFRKLDDEEFARFSKSFIKKRTQEGKLDPEREVINLLLMLNNKQGMLYVRKKEAAKDPTTDSSDLIRKYSDDIKKLELQLRVKAKRLGITQQRIEELKRLFISARNVPLGA